MNFKSVIHSHIQDHKDVVNHLDEETIKKIEEVSNLLVDCLSNGKTIFWCGNGGSAGDSQHLAAELIGRYKNDRRPLRSIALTTDSSAITCISNDYSYDKVFERQIEGLGTKGDVLIGISTSGNSFNVINAVKKANKIGVTTVCMLGNNGGAANEIADHSIIINSQSTARIQEMHIFVGHIFCDLIEHGLSLK
ncbi:MAG: D-sedoheptulose 7-phosphate isomerase [Gammaproteobacteria bacterium]|jgi:D-sedoheptulose 7-phosphate isomerase|nr:D-sedoheptulose 7-phosphate isomerase [Gammaproteobacteria bacterium]|tara:strand:- start:97 stop:675 length:579 start_codon:yes stop_codon:yes gene_type:complete